MAGLKGISENVQFSWAGAERLSAELRATANVCESQIRQREKIAGDAQKDWRGTFAEEFKRRMKTCNGDAQRLAGALRDAANKLDDLSKQARDEQNRREKAREWRQRMDDRNFVEKWWEGDQKPPGSQDEIKPKPVKLDTPVPGSRG